MSQFEYVAVLVSLIVGLALTQLLRGIGNMASDTNWPKSYWVHIAWTVYLFAYTTMFWWWEFQFVSVEWKLSLYVLLVVYATLLYFTAIIVQPSNVKGIIDFKDYYYEKRHIIFGTWIFITMWDILDSLAKGAGHLFDLGPNYLIGHTITFIGAGIAIWTSNERYHQIFVAVLWAMFCMNMVTLFFIIG